MGKSNNHVNVLNNNICRTFSLNDLLSNRGQRDNKATCFLKKNALMNKLAHDKTVKKSLLAALFFVSKRMGSDVPCIFQAWKEYTFERRASKIHELLSSANLSNEMSGFASPLGMTVNPNNQTKELGSFKSASDNELEDNSGCMDAENDYDEYFDKHEVEEYISVVHNDLPIR